MSRMRGARVSCEVTPHHLWFDDSRLTYRVNPPIRKADDVNALIDAIKDGTVTCIGTDHAPHRRGKGEGRRRYGGSGNRVRRLLHQALP